MHETRHSVIEESATGSVPRRDAAQGQATLGLVRPSRAGRIARATVVAPILLLLASPVWAQSEGDPPSHDGSTGSADQAGVSDAGDDQGTDANADLLSHIDDALDREIRELSDLARGRGEGPIEDVEDLNRTLPEGEGQLGYNAVTSDANPLVSDDCHQQAMRDAILHLAAHEHMEPGAAVRMGRGHLAEREARIEEGEVTYADYIEHIAECKAFCGPLVKELMGCHVSAVQNLDHQIVFFPLDSFEVAGDASSRAIQRTADTLAIDPERTVLLIGRASRIGKLGYNRRLSGLRANSVRDQLTAGGIDAERVRTLVFGYEPPQLDREIASAYGYGDAFDQIGTSRINQSVLMVVY